MKRKAYDSYLIDLWTFRPADISPQGLFTPWTSRPQTIRPKMNRPTDNVNINNQQLPGFLMLLKINLFIRFICFFSFFH